MTGQVVLLWSKHGTSPIIVAQWCNRLVFRKTSFSITRRLGLKTAENETRPKLFLRWSQRSAHKHLQNGKVWCIKCATFHENKSMSMRPGNLNWLIFSFLNLATFWSFCFYGIWKCGGPRMWSFMKTNNLTKQPNSKIINVNVNDQ